MRSQSQILFLERMYLLCELFDVLFRFRSMSFEIFLVVHILVELVALMYRELHTKREVVHFL